MWWNLLDMDYSLKKLRTSGSLHMTSGSLSKGSCVHHDSTHTLHGLCQCATVSTRRRTCVDLDEVWQRPNSPKELR